MKDSNGISRRNFLKIAGSATLAAAGLSACDNGKTSSAEADAATGEMTMRINHNTGDKVSLLGFGMMRLPTVSGRSAREGNDEIDQEKVNALVDRAIEGGVNYFDTAPPYCSGRSEIATGIALSRYPRDKYFIATKLSNYAPQTWPFEESTAIYYNSLKRLQTDYIDYMLMHGIGSGRDGLKELHQRFLDNGLLDFLLKEREAGRIRNLGFSYHGDIRAFNYLLEQHDKYKWDFVLIQLNYLDWRYAKEMNPANTNAEYLYNELVKRNIPAMIMEPLLGGRLSNVPDNILKMFKERDSNASVASWAFRFAGSFPNVLTVLSGMTEMEHLENNLATYSPLKPLSDDEFEFLQRVADQMMMYDTIPCNDCKYCMPCPYGIDIPAILLHYNKCLNEGNIISNPGDSGYKKARRAYLIGYDRSVPKLRQADHCIACDQCSPHCPQRINIPQEMQRISKYVEHLRRN